MRDDRGRARTGALFRAMLSLEGSLSFGFVDHFQDVGSEF